MKGKLIATVLFGALLLGGCVAKFKVPTGMPDGVGTHVFMNNKPRIEYTGNWQGSRPKGQGQVRWIYSDSPLTCQGEFGIERPEGAGPDVPDAATINYGRGDVHVDGKLVFSGNFYNNFSSQVSVCQPIDGLMHSDGLQLTATFLGFDYMFDGPCKVQLASGEALAGHCSATQSDQYFKFPQWGNRAAIMLLKFNMAEKGNYFRLVKGPGIYIDINGTRYEGEINRSSVLNGTYKVTRKGEQASTIARLVDGKIMVEHLLPEAIAAQGKACGASHWLLVKGDCIDGAWSGVIDAYTEDGKERLQADLARGTATITSLASDVAVRGQLPSPFSGEVAFARGQLMVGGVVEYDGEMQGLKPHGKGVCMFEGARESCEYFDGERIDPLFKMRQETRRATGATAPAGSEGVAAPAANYTATGQPAAAPATAGSTAAAIAAECAKKFVALKACDRMPGLGANLCRAAANKKFSHLACSVIQ